MGKTVAVFSGVKNSGKSVVTYILANQIREIISEDKKVLVCCLNSKFSLLYKLLGIDESAPGIEELINLQESGCGQKSGNLHDIIPKSNGIHFLGSYKTTTSYVNRNVAGFLKLIDRLEKDFDLIIFDTVSSKENAPTNIALEKSSLMINLFVQDAESVNTINSIMEGRTERETMYLISKYRDIYPRVGDIKRRFSLGKVYTMNYCRTLQEMKNRDSLHFYLQRDTECNSSARLISRYIAEAFSLELKPSEKEQKGVNYLKSIFSNMFMIQ